MCGRACLIGCVLHRTVQISNQVGYHDEPNRSFLNLNEIEDGIMHKDTTTAKITDIEKEKNKKISRKRYIRFQPGGPPGQRVEQYFGLSHLHCAG